MARTHALPARRGFLKSLAALSAAGLARTTRAAAAVPPLKIERIEAIKVVVPMRPGVVMSENYPNMDIRLRDFDKYPKFILKMYAGDGLLGLGETGREVPEAGVKANIAHLMGKNLAQLDLASPSLGLPDARTADAFEIAIYDLMGKVLGLPVHALLGGRMQDKVAVSYWTGQRTDADLVRVGQRAVELGFKNLKFKARLGDPIDKQLAAVATANPGLSFIVDFNSSYPNPASFLQMAQRLQGYNLIIEDPVPKRLEWFRQLRERLTIPFAITPGGGQQMFEAVRAKACDVLNLGGNMRSFVRSCYFAELAGLPVWHGSGVELGIRDMSFIQAAAATRSCTIPSDTLCYMRESDLLATPFRVVNGFITVPTTPGLGVDLDEAALKRFRVA
ncbi:MAG: enolase C-terminal domain-like protein [Bryobacteraceae bacterium]